MKDHRTIALGVDQVPAIKSQTVDEARLIQLMRDIAQRHDKAAFGELFDIFAPRLKVAFVRSGMDGSSAEDLLQDVMISVWTKAGLFDATRGSLFAWVFTIARNTRIDRQRRIKGTVSIDAVEWDMADGADSSELTVLKNSDAAALRKALLSLASEQRVIVEMAFVQELSQTDIASALKLPLGTVKSRMRLAYAHLRKALEPYT